MTAELALTPGEWCAAAFLIFASALLTVEASRWLAYPAQAAYFRARRRVISLIRRPVDPANRARD